MKYIKKVSVAELVSNTGTIIDSMNPGDDHHTNAPSIDAVETFVTTNAILSGLTNASWTSAQINSNYITSGNCRYIEIGKMVFVIINELRFTSNIARNTQAQIIGGLPHPPTNVQMILQQAETSRGGRVILNNSGNLLTWYDTFYTGGTNGTETYFGYFFYIKS